MSMTRNQILHKLKTITLEDILKILIVLLVFVIYSRYYPNTSPYVTQFEKGYRGTDVRCVDYLHEGVLYQGQLYCGLPPVPYLYGYLTLSLFGWSLFWQIMYALNVVMNIFLFYLIWRTIKIEIGKVDLLFPLLCYLIYVYFPSFGNTYTILSTVFLYTGFFLLFHSKNKFREPLAGVFFSLSILSLITSVLAVFILLLFYIKKIGLINVELKKKPILTLGGHESLSKVGALLTSTMLVLLIFLIVFPNFPIYVFRLTSTSQSRHLSDVLLLMLPQTTGTGGVLLGRIILYMMIALSFWVFMKDRCVYSASAFVGIPILMFLIIKNIWISELPLYYFMVYYPMIIVSLVKCWNRVKSNAPARVLVLTTFTLIVVFPGLIRLNLVLKGNELNKLVDYPLSLIPKQEGKTLVEGDVIKLNLKNKDVIPLNYVNIDDLLGEKIYNGLSRYMRSYSREYTQRHPDLIDEEIFYRPTMREASYGKGIIDGDYSLIVYGPPFFWSVISIYNSVWEEIKFDGYYDVYLPNQIFLAHGGRHHTTLLFKNKEHRDYMLKEIVEYYNNSKIFNNICSLDRYTAEYLIPLVMSKNNITFERKCVGGGDLTAVYSDKIRNLQPTDVLFAVAIVILVALVDKRANG